MSLKSAISYYVQLFFFFFKKNFELFFYLVLGFTAESENVFRLSIRDFVDTEPFVGGTDKTRQVLLDVLDIWTPDCV